MANALFLYRNVIDGATMTQSSAAIDADDGSSLGASRLQEPMLSRIARTTRAENEFWRGLWAQPVAIDTVALWKHNATPNGVIPIALHAEQEMTQLVYSGEHFFWPSLYGMGEAPFDEITMGGMPIRSELDDYVPYTLIRLGQVYSVGALTFGMRDPSNPDYHLDGGRLIAGVGWSPAYNYDLNWTWDVADEDRRADLDGGGVSMSRGASWRVMRLTFSFLDLVEGNTFLMDLKRRVRRSAELLFIGHPGVMPEEPRTAIYGVFNVNGELRKVTPKHYGFSAEIREIVA